MSVKELIPKTMEVFVLDIETKIEIRKKLEIELSYLGYKELDIDELIENAMDSKLCDLEDTINIYALKTIKVI